MTVVCLVRHGESVWNRDGRIQGQREPALSQLGRRQAVSVADRLAGAEWDALFSSDLARAAQTVLPIGRRLGLPVQPEPALRERGQGVLEGLTAAEALRAYPDFDTPEVRREPLAEFGRRCALALERIVARYGTGRVVVVTHGGVIRRLRMSVPAGPADVALDNHPPGNGSVSILDTAGVTGVWRCYDDTAHLADAGVHMRHEHPALTALMDPGRDVG